MTPKDIGDRIARIRSLAKTDYEAAHAERDDLWEDVLAYLATHGKSEEDQNLAACALLTKLIDIPLYCA
jgi:hypothetical protein